MIRRRLLTLSASAALHLAALGLALVVAGAGAGSAIVMDLVADVEGDAITETRAPSVTSSGSGETEPIRKTPARRLAPSTTRGAHSASSSTPTAVQGGSVVSESAPVPGSEAVAETRPKREREPETESAVAPEPRIPDPEVPAATPEGPAAISSIPSGAGMPRRDRAAATGGSSGTDAGASAGERLSRGPFGFAAGTNAASMTTGTSAVGPGGIPPEYGPYLQRFRRRLQESLEYPLAARRQGLTGSVELEILLEPSGRIGTVRVISSSSHALLDDAALRAVRRLAPEPLPAPLPRRPLRIRLPLGFELE